MPTVRFGRNYKMHAGKVVKTTKSRFDVHFDDDQTLKGMDPKDIWFLAATAGGSSTSGQLSRKYGCTEYSEFGKCPTGNHGPGLQLGPSSLNARA